MMESQISIIEAVEAISEEHMTDSQMKKREEIVMSLKKNADDFKKRYGDDWKSVIYAIATKQAMNESVIQIDESFFMPSDVEHEKEVDPKKNVIKYKFDSEKGDAVKNHLTSLGFREGKDGILKNDISGMVAHLKDGSLNIKKIED